MKAFCRTCRDLIDPEWVSLIMKLADNDPKMKPLPEGWLCGKCAKKKYSNFKLRSKRR
jgi:hypothetical protein